MFNQVQTEILREIIFIIFHMLTEVKYYLS